MDEVVVLHYEYPAWLIAVVVVSIAVMVLALAAWLIAEARHRG